MKIEEAIEILTNLLSEQQGKGLSTRIDAIKLGIEALKFTQAVRGTILSYATLPLPGETE